MELSTKVASQIVQFNNPKVLNKFIGFIKFVNIGNYKKEKRSTHICRQEMVHKMSRDRAKIKAKAR